MIRGRGVNKTLVRMMIVEEALHHVSSFDNMIGYKKMTSPHVYAGELDAIYCYIYSVKKMGCSLNYAYYI